MIEFITVIPSTDKSVVTESILSKFILHDEYFVFYEKSYVDYTDEDLGTTENQLRVTAFFQLRSKVTGCKKHWYCNTKVWGVEVNTMGSTDNPNPCFKRESQAQEFCDAIIQWLLKSPSL